MIPAIRTKTKEIFEALEVCTSPQSVREIMQKYLMASEFEEFEKKYPKIDFTITKDELNGIEFDHEGNLILSSLKITSPLEKLFYAVLWKNGDLPKLKHVVKGIKGIDPENERIVFHQFGRHLSNTDEPIIDQHVLRAVREYIQLEKETDSEILNEYKKWRNKIPVNATDRAEVFYLIDKVLFFLGKSLKPKKPGAR